MAPDYTDVAAWFQNGHEFSFCLTVNGESCGCIERVPDMSSMQFVVPETCLVTARDEPGQLWYAIKVFDRVSGTGIVSSPLLVSRDSSTDDFDSVIDVNKSAEYNTGPSFDCYEFNSS